MKHMGSQWMETLPPAVKHGVLATGPAGKNQPGDSWLKKNANNFV